jgi:hypothetical protein
LRVVLAHVRVVRGAEANRALLALVANVNADEHGLVRDLWAEAHAPEVSAELGVHLADNVEEDTVIFTTNSAIGYELGDDGAVAVDLVLQERVEVLVIRVIWHDNQEDKLGVLDCAARLANLWLHFFVVVVLYRFAKRVQKQFLVVGCLVRHRADVGVVHFDVQAFLDGQVVELVVDVVRIDHVLLQAEDCELFKHFWLMDH